MALVNLQRLPGVGRLTGPSEDFPGFPEFPDVSQSRESIPLGSETAIDAGNHFGQLLEQAIDAVNRQEQRSDDLALAAATGASIDPHQMMIEAAKAEAMVHLTSSISTKMAQNVQTIMNMQI